jgi:hypothetical protein
VLNNAVTIGSALDNNAELRIKGGYVPGKDKKASANNVTIKAGVKAIDIIGGSVGNIVKNSSGTNAEANDNTLEIENAIITSARSSDNDSGKEFFISGGKINSGSGTANGNEVTISGNSNLNGNGLKTRVSGGYVHSGGTTTGNIVTIEAIGTSQPIFDGSVTLQGGSGSDVTGNKLVLKRVNGLKVEEVSGFQELEVLLPNSIDNGDTILEAKNVTLGKDSNVPAKIAINSSMLNSDTLSTEDFSFYLVKAETKLEIKGDLAEDLQDENGHIWGISLEDNKDLKATLKELAVMVESVQFGSLKFGYDQPDKKSIPIINLNDQDDDVKGENAVTLSGTSPEAFALAHEQDSDYWYIVPRLDLKFGRYEATINVRTTKGRTASSTVDFTVDKSDNVDLDFLGDIKHVSVNDEEGTVNIVGSKASGIFYIDSQTIKIAYPAGKLVFPAGTTGATPGASLTVTGEGTLIPAGTKVEIIAKDAKGGEHPISGTVTVSDGKTSVAFDLPGTSKLPEGTYDLSLRSTESSANPYFTAHLATGFEVASTTSTTGTTSGGCDAGFGGIAALFALGMAVTVRGKRA